MLILTVAVALPSMADVATTQAVKARRQEISDSLKRVLPKVKSSSERIDILYDIFDLAPTDSVNVTGERVLAAAKEAGDTVTVFDMLRRLASFNQARDSARVMRYLDEIQGFPSTPESDATECFIYLCAMTSRARYAGEKERFDQISSLIREYKEGSPSHESVNDRVALLFTLCNYLDLTLPGEILTSYLRELEHLLKKMPYRLDALENMYYLHAAMTYTDNDQPAQAIAADRALLAVINDIDAKSQQEGRKYRNYDRFRYTVYRRMLSNAEALAPAEVDQIYSLLMKIKERTPEVNADMAKNPSAEAYYLFAKERYTQAQPLLMKSLEGEKRFVVRSRLLRMLVKTTSETGDMEVYMKALKDYNDVLEETLRQRTLERGKELRTLYNVTDYNERQTLDRDELERQLDKNRFLLTFFVVALVLLVAAVVWFIVLYRRYHRLSRQLQESNSMLVAERDNLRRTQESLIDARDQARKASRHKTDFISNMSHEVSTPLNAIIECAHLIVDNVSEEKRHYLERFAQTIDISADVLRTLISDVLEINNVETGRLVIQRSTVPVATLCQAALQSVKNHANPGVELIWANSEAATEVIFTDPRRVEQVLVNLLLNGLKFTEHGFVELACKVDVDAGTTTFTVTDTGIGVPEGKEEQIFERFEKLSSMTQGTGLGLSISRMIANMLDAKLFVDTTYSGEGTRFVFIIPSRP